MYLNNVRTARSNRLNAKFLLELFSLRLVWLIYNNTVLFEVHTTNNSVGHVASANKEDGSLCLRRHVDAFVLQRRLSKENRFPPDALIFEWSSSGMN